MSLKASLDIIIVNYRSIEDTLGAIASVSPWPRGRIRVVDNSDDPLEAASLSLALQQFPEVQLLVPEKNVGFGEGCNLAYSHSTSKFLLLLNPDARISPPDIELLAAVMEEDSRWGAVSPNTYWDSRRRFLLPTPFPMTPGVRLVMALATRLPPLLIRLCVWLRLTHMRQRLARSRPFAVSCLAGAILLVRREAVLAAGGLFDPAFFMFFEDTDLSQRLRKKGYALGIVPAASAVHGYRHKAYKLAMMAESEKIYYPKHFPWIYRNTRELARLDRLGRPLDWASLVSRDIGQVHGAEELTRRIGGGGILGVGISPLLEAFVFRPMGEAPAQLSIEDWERLEPGRYVAIVPGHGQWMPPVLQMFAFRKGEIPSGSMEEVYMSGYPEQDCPPGWSLQAIGVEQSEEMRALFSRVFSQEMEQDFWHWKYGEGRGCGIGVWRDGRMVAHFGGLVRYILLHGQRCEGVQIVDVMAEAAGRSGVSRKGAFFHAAATFLESYVGVGKQFLLAYGFPNDRHTRVGEHLGLYERVDRISEISWPALQARPSLKTRLRAIGRGCDDPRLARKINTLWGAMAADLRRSVIGERDWDYVRHRYLGHPAMEYQVLLASRRIGGRGVGLLVARPDGDALLLLDVIAPLANLPEMIHHARRLAARLGLVSLKAWITASHLQPFMVQGGEALETDIYIPNCCWCPGLPPEEVRDQWWLTAGDTDFQ